MNDDSRLHPNLMARRLIRSCDRAVLATLLGDQGGWPYGSLVLTACEHDATPLLFISDLAVHTRNTKRDSRVSLLFDGTGGLDDPLTGPRATIMGRAHVTTNDDARVRFLARHPSARVYQGFADFHIYSVDIERVHIVSGFGRIDWVDGDAVSGLADVSLKEQEADVIAHMNDDHSEAIQAYAKGLLGLDGNGWRMTGCDPEGFDLRLGGETARLDFENVVEDAMGARAEFVRLVKRARGESPDS